MAIENVDTYNEYLTKLEAAADMSILNFKNLIDALQKRHDFFASQGCRLSDHGILTFYAEPYTDAEIEAIFLKARMKKELTVEENRQIPFCHVVRICGYGCQKRLGTTVPLWCNPQQQRPHV